MNTQVENEKTERKNKESENQVERMAANLFRQCILRSLDLPAIMNESSRFHYLLTFSELTHRHIVIRNKRHRLTEKKRALHTEHNTHTGTHTHTQHENNRRKREKSAKKRRIMNSINIFRLNADKRNNLTIKMGNCLCI